MEKNKKEIYFTVKSFSEFNLEELYQVLQLRSEIFVVEQDCVYQDIDDKDQRALHVMGWKDKELVAYARCFDKNDYFTEASIGRVLVKKEYRNLDYGKKLMKKSIESIENQFGSNTIKISAQQYLIPFYEALGFKTIGEGYLEDAIPHIAMRKDK